MFIHGIAAAFVSSIVDLSVNRYVYKYLESLCATVCRKMEQTAGDCLPSLVEFDLILVLPQTIAISSQRE